MIDVLETTGVEYICNTCNKVFYRRPSRKSKYCSRKCFYKGITGAKNYQWKGDNCCYVNIHKWLGKYHGKPKYCEICKTTEDRHHEWALKKGMSHSKNIQHYLRLCKKCHVEYDQSIEKGSERYNSVTTEDDVLSMRRLYDESNLSKKRISEIFGLGYEHTCSIINANIWKHVTYRIKKRPFVPVNTRLNKEKVKLIRLLYGTFNWSQRRIGLLYNMQRGSISPITQRKSWKNI